RLERAGSLSGIAVLALLIVSGVVHNHAIFARIPWGGYVSAAALGLIGMALGYAAAAVARLPPAARRAVSLETGIQNSSLALRFFILSSPKRNHDANSLMPLLYPQFVLFNTAFVSRCSQRTDADCPDLAPPSSRPFGRLCNNAANATSISVA